MHVVRQGWCASRRIPARAPPLPRRLTSWLPTHAVTALTALIEPRLQALPRRIALEWPGGEVRVPEAHVRLRLHDARHIQALAAGEIGKLADAYVRGEVDIEGSLPDTMALAAALVGDPVRRGALRAPMLRWLARARSHWQHTLARDARQVQSHYDVGDDFYALWLDPLRVYSCAYFADETSTLEQAQQAKLDLVCRKLQLTPGQRLLDVGAGWGALLLWAAKHYRVRASGITLSWHQHAYVQSLIEREGLRGQVDVRMIDYRTLSDDTENHGSFDRIASVGMFEHVGRAQLNDYFRRLYKLLRAGGLLLNHGIASAGLDNEQLGGGMGDFIARHIFPGGELVHVSKATEALARGGFELLDAENLRPHYARTLWAWSTALERQLGRARAVTSEATVRAYRLYLAGSAMCFEQGWLALYQLLAARPDGRIDAHAMRGAQSDHAFRRHHLLPP
jgi:cyclopropane-fatty-acyl-phospholipid synthase